MLFALDKNGDKTHIDLAKRSEDYFCPCCGSKMILKLGDIRTHHFAHPSDGFCKDTWHYDMAEWHYEWQNKFPKECQEVVKEFNGKKHRADVLIENYKVVFEFQHSALSSEEFERRNNFYNKLGYTVIWIFDVEEQLQNEQIDNYRGNIWSWTRPRRTFDHFNSKNKNVKLYLQINNEDIALIKVTWNTEDNGLSRFATDGYEYDEESIIHMFDVPKEAIAKEVKLSSLYDKLIQLNSKDHTTYFFGCPISSTHLCASTNIDIPTSRYSEIMPCIECEHQCESIQFGVPICKKRFKDIGLDGNTFVRVESKDKNGFINKLSYIVEGNRRYKYLPTFEQNFSKDVFTLWKENDCYIATFRNVRTGKYIRIYKDPKEQYNKYHKVYGFLSTDKYSFPQTSVELFGLDKPEWVIDWFKMG